MRDGTLVECMCVCVCVCVEHFESYRALVTWSPIINTPTSFGYWHQIIYIYIPMCIEIVQL